MEDKHMKIKHRLAFGAAMGLFFAMSLLVYGPVSLYITGSEEMWFSFHSLLLPVALVGLAGFALVTLLCSLSKGAVHKLLCCLVFGVSLGLFIQGGFFNISYGSGVLDGSQIAWRDYTTYGAIDSAMWAACLALPFAFYMVFKRSWRHFLMIAAGFIVVIQIAGLGLMMYQNQDLMTRLSHEVTKDGIYELSDEDNTLVFVLSNMDRKYFEKYKKTHKEYKEELGGFTEYDNTLSTGAGSVVSFPSLLTGEVYKKDIRYADYIDHIWDGKNVFDVLSRAGVDARIYSDDLYFSNDAAYTVRNVVDRVQDYSSYRAITKTIYKYTLYNFAPHYLKRFLWMNTSEFSAYQGNNTYTRDDAQFYAEFEQNGGFSFTDSYDSAVRIYYLDGASTPYRLTEDGKYDSAGTSRDEQVAGSFNSLFSILDNLREHNRYHSSRIIITADNGTSGLSQNPILLYKEKGSAYGYEQSRAPITLFDIAPTLVSQVSDRYYSYGSGKTISDATSMSRDRVRYFYLNAGSNADSRIEQYKCTSDAANSETLVLMNNFYINNGVVDSYVLGDELTFTIDETAAIYCNEGFGHTNGWRTILRGPRGGMTIPIHSIPKNAEDLHVYFDVLSVYENTQCTITANNTTVFDEKLDPTVKSTGLNFLIPAKVLGPDNKLTLRFTFSEIDDSEMELEVDKRTPIMSFTAFKIYTQ